MLNNDDFVPAAEKYMDTVYRVAYGWLKDPDDANDVTQEVLIQLYKTNKEFLSDFHLKNWLIRVAVNQCKMLFRSPWRRMEDIDAYAETLGISCYAADLGGIQRRLQVWIQGELTDVTVEFDPAGSYEMHYTDAEGNSHEQGGGGGAIGPGGVERPLTPDELMENLNTPDVRYLEYGSVWLYYMDRQVDITDSFQDGVCYVELSGGGETLYVTVKYGDGYSWSPHSYVSPDDFGTSPTGR